MKSKPVVNIALIIGVLSSAVFIPVAVRFSYAIYSYIDWILIKNGDSQVNDHFATNFTMLLISFLFILPILRSRDLYKKVGTLSDIKAILLTLVTGISMILFWAFAFGFVNYIIIKLSRIL